MNEERLQQILEHLAQMGLSQMIISDPAAICYLTGIWVNPGERALALYISAHGTHRLFVNNLFTLPKNPPVEVVRFDDTQDVIRMLAAVADPELPMGVDKNWGARFLLRLMELLPNVHCYNTSLCVDRVRARKDPQEQAKMRTASLLNDRCMALLVPEIVPGITEIQLATRVRELYKTLGAQGVSFEPLIAFGANGAVGHGEPTRTPAKVGDCVLVDIGCVLDGYCSDMTRSFFLGEASQKHRELYALVRRANEAAQAMIRPGVRFCDIDAAARSVIADAGWGANFTHRLGHSIGMECHEFGDVSAANTDTVQPGMTFSVEPGIYLEGEVGLRLEDLVLVTETGCEILNHYPHDLKVL